MIFAKVDVCLPTHPRFIAAGPAAVGYWTAALTYVRGHELDGKLPDHAVGVLLGVGPSEGRRLAAKLVSVGLFEKADDGFVICNYSNKNETKADVDARRSATNARVQKHREQRARNGPSNAVSNGVGNTVSGPLVTPIVPGSGSDSGSVSSSLPSELSPAPRDYGPGSLGRSGAGDGAYGMAFDAWCGAIRQVTGGTVVVAMTQRAALLEAIRKGAAEAGEDPIAWAERSARAFAREGGPINVFRYLEFIASPALSKKPSANRLDGPVKPDPDAVKGPEAEANFERLQDLLAGIGRMPEGSAG